MSVETFHSKTQMLTSRRERKSLISQLLDQTDFQCWSRMFYEECFLSSTASAAFRLFSFFFFAALASLSSQPDSGSFLHCQQPSSQGYNWAMQLTAFKISVLQEKKKNQPEIFLEMKRMPQSFLQIPLNLSFSQRLISPSGAVEDKGSAHIPSNPVPPQTFSMILSPPSLLVKMLTTCCSVRV